MLKKNVKKKCFKTGSHSEGSPSGRGNSEPQRRSARTRPLKSGVSKKEKEKEILTFLFSKKKYFSLEKYLSLHNLSGQLFYDC